MFLRFIFLLFCIAMVSACGGGSSTDSGERPIIIDSDGDGVVDIDDAFPQDPSESVDTDGDGIGDNADVFPQDSGESIDTDNDGIGNNADEDDDGDMVADVDDAFPLNAQESIDTDGDGIGDNSDDDIDNDGVQNSEDTFPYDATESTDSDEDGIGNNKDFYPQNNLCFKESDGNGEDCYLTLLSQESSEQLQFLFLGDELVIYSPQLNKLLELNGSSAEFSELLQLPDEVEISSITYSKHHDRIYLVTDDSSEISYVSKGELIQFYKADTPIRRIIAAGEFVLFDSYEDSRDINLLDHTGTVQFELTTISFLSSTGTSYFSLSGTPYFSETKNTLYICEIAIKQGLDSDGWTYDEYFSLVRKIKLPDDETTSPLASQNEFEFAIKEEIIPVNEELFLCGQKLVDSNSLMEVQDLRISPVDSMPHADSSFTILEEHSESVLDGDEINELISSRVSRFMSDFKKIDVREYEGELLQLFGEKSLHILTKTPERLYLFLIDIVDDVDGDGIKNEEDNYPYDPAASLDSDGDGYPDAWNDNATAEDSVLELALDAFPNDKFCWFEEHAARNGDCDYRPKNRDFEPTETAKSKDVLYMANGQLIYRWSISQQKYLSPFQVQSQLKSMAYLEASQRLYLLFQEGGLSYYDLNTGELIVVWENTSFRHIQAAGDKLVMWSTYYFDCLDFTCSYTVMNSYDTSGKPLDEYALLKGKYISFNSVWNSFDSRFYSSVGGSPTKHSSLGFDLNSGMFLDYKEHTSGLYQIDPSISLERFDLYERTHAGYLVTIENLSEGFALHRYNENDEIVESVVYSGQVAGLYSLAHGLVIVRTDDGVVKTEVYCANDDSDCDNIPDVQDAFPLDSNESLDTDSDGIGNNLDDDDDGDGVADIEDAYPLDPAASVDSDGDGLPDSWNENSSANDSTLSLELDAYPQDSYCWLQAHGTGEADCEHRPRTSNFNAKLTATSNDTVFMVEQYGNTLYRWSVSEQRFLASVQLMGTPNTIVFNKSQQRLYLSYGYSVNYFELDMLEEQFYKRFEDKVTAMIAVDQLLLVITSYYSVDNDNFVVSNGTLRSLDIYGDELDNLSSYRLVNNVSLSWDMANSLLWWASGPLFVDIETGSLIEQPLLDFGYGFFSKDSFSVLASPSGGKLLVGSDKVYNRQDESIEQLPFDMHFNGWTSAEQAVTLTQQEQSFVLRLYNQDLELEEQLTFNGQALNLVSSDGQIVIMSYDDEGFKMALYQPKDD